MNIFTMALTKSPTDAISLPNVANTDLLFQLASVILAVIRPDQGPSQP